MNDVIKQKNEEVSKQFLVAEERLRNYLWVGAILILIGTLITASLGYKSINLFMSHWLVQRNHASDFGGQYGSACRFGG